ncbi:hypothetical protein PLUTO_00700 [Luteibacter phage vB_LflM-Pluto]|uniref:Uncharacterized protein n=1 Tax=Luteibacter phage vB_LflM-Pluto TaxID=2948611 RepID=A0A9E7MVA5_9CAUD|nr:hypothetical protein PLUTO_00700 [Luteibacter phage vB_LflM-Pluto]
MTSSKELKKLLTECYDLFRTTGAHEFCNDDLLSRLQNAVTEPTDRAASPEDMEVYQSIANNYADAQCGCAECENRRGGRPDGPVQEEPALPQYEPDAKGMAFVDGMGWSVQCSRAVDYVAGLFAAHSELAVIIARLQAEAKEKEPNKFYVATSSFECYYILNSILEELNRAIRKFPTWPTDPLHAVNVLNEEVGELNRAVLQQVYEPHKNKAGTVEVRDEALQSAAMAVRFLLSLPKYRFAPTDQHQQDAV